MSTILDTLVYDRTQNDIVELQNLRSKIATGNATASDYTKWNAGMKGALNYTDLNRIGDCLAYMQTWLASNGITVTITARNDWAIGELVTSTDLDKIQTDILTIANALGYPFGDLYNDQLCVYFDHNSSEIDPNILNYIQYNLIEKSIQYCMPTVAWRYFNSDQLYVVHWTPDDVSLNAYDLIEAKGYSSSGIIEMIVNGYGDMDFVASSRNDARLYELTKLAINIKSSSMGGYYFTRYTKELTIGKLFGEIPENFGESKNANSGANIIEKLEILDGITKIGNYAFMGFDELVTLTLGKDITTIGDHAFNGCDKLPFVQIPNSVTSIGWRSFHDCQSLAYIQFGTGLTSIGEDAFANCTSLTSITLPSGITDIGAFAFSDCSSLSTINYSGTTAQWASVTKRNRWADNTQATVVHCTDGDVAI